MMDGLVIYALLFCATLSSLHAQHEHRSRLDTSPDMVLKPVTRNRRPEPTTQRTASLKFEFRLPEPQHGLIVPADKDDLLSSDDDYDEYDYSDQFSAGSSGTVHQDDRYGTEAPSETISDYGNDEYEDRLSGHKDHLTDASADVTCRWYTILLSLLLLKFL